MAKILVVDDSETLRNQLRKILDEAGHQVSEAFDGVNGLEVLQNNAGIQLIICDVNMPRMDGLTMCQKVHESPALSKIPIFMLTTESNLDMKAKGKEAGVLAWITKPFSAPKLVSAVEKVTQK